MDKVTKQQNPVIDSSCSPVSHRGRQFSSLSPGIVPEAVHLRAVVRIFIIKPIKSSGDN